jgi:DNA-binding SARP family transcriptional activator/alpha-beta hydrolase superfamily lysophospholipase
VASVFIRLLGGFEVRIDDRPVPPSSWAHQRASDLVKLLALANGQRLHREQVIEALWPDLDPEAGAANLHKAAHHARRTLGAAGAVVLQGGHVDLWSGASVEVDAAQFKAEAEAALAAREVDACRRAAGHYGGELLPDDRYKEWTMAHRDHLRSLYLQTLRRAGHWERVVAEEPTDEAAHRMLIRMHAAAGNRYAALTQFHTLRDALAQELGLDPDPESLALYQEIMHGPIATSPIRYVRSRGVSIAFQVVQGGPSDLLMIPGWISHLALDWEEPLWVAWCERMTSFARLIRFDKRGTGLSDRPTGIQPLEERMEDARAVLDAAGLSVVDILGWSEGGPLGLLFAATYPERVRSLVLYGTQASFVFEPDYPWGATNEEREAFSARILDSWGHLDFARWFAPKESERFAVRYAAYQRAGASPTTAAELNRMNLSIDVRQLLPQIRVPTLVMNRRDDRIAPGEAGRYAAVRIPGARFIELEGEDHLPWVGDTEAICAAIEAFLMRLPAPRPVESPATARDDESTTAPEHPPMQAGTRRLGRKPLDSERASRPPTGR